MELKFRPMNTGGIMKSNFWRQGVVALLTAGLLATAAIAQEGAEGEVNIEEAPAATTSEVKPATPPPAPRVKPQIVDRDPFVNQLVTGVVLSDTAPSRRPAPSVRPATNASGSTASAQPTVTKTASGTEIEDEEVEIPAPEVTVNGIVTSGHGRQAIISTSVGTRMITPGQKLGDYRVSNIGPDYVTFNYGGEKEFKVPLESEF